jgi:Domain of unknown function (DUF5710)
MAEIQYPIALRFDFVFNTKAKAAGAQWNPTLNQWEAHTPAALFKCRKWAPPNQQLGVLWKREWLDVPSTCIKRAKMFNARFDPKSKCWYDPFGSASQSAAMLNPYRLRRQSWYR